MNTSDDLAAAVVTWARQWRYTGKVGGFDHMRSALHLVDAVDALDREELAARTRHLHAEGTHTSTDGGQG